MQLKWPMLWDLFSLFPAHAGVILEPVIVITVMLSFPRTRGGDPGIFRAIADFHVFSPHTRG